MPKISIIVLLLIGEDLLVGASCGDYMPVVVWRLHGGYWLGQGLQGFTQCVSDRQFWPSVNYRGRNNN